jgi:hypothetical protein
MPVVFEPVEDVVQTGSVTAAAARLLPHEPVQDWAATPLWPAQVPFHVGEAPALPEREAPAPVLPDIVVEIPAQPEVAVVFVAPEPVPVPDPIDPAYVDPRAQARNTDASTSEAVTALPDRPGSPEVARRPERNMTERRRSEVEPQPFVLPSALASR